MSEEMNDEKRKRGRPRKDSSYEEYCGFRMTTDDIAKLTHVMVETDKSKSEIMRDFFNKYYAIWKNSL